MNAPLAIGGARLRWTELPAALRGAIETAAGAPVRAAESQPGGFSPGLATILRLADGRSVFVKAVSAARNPDSPAMHRQEAAVLAQLPPEVPAPRLLWSHDDGEWVALMTTAVDGATPDQPWRPDQLDAFLDLAERLIEVLTPSPVRAPAIDESLGTSLTGWRSLHDEPDRADRLDPWTRANLDRLAAIEAGWVDAAAGDTLLHGDLRSDNVLLTATGAVAVDWPSACRGAGWVDLLFAVPSIAMHGGGPAEAVWRRYRPGRAADPEAVTTVLVAITGYFLHRSMQPVLPHFPTLRQFQRAQGDAGLAWLRERLE